MFGRPPRHRARSYLEEDGTMGVRRSAACRTTLLLSLAGVIVIPHPALAAARPPLDLELCAPDENSFTRHVDNELFPLPVGRVWVYTGEDEGETLGLRIAVLDRTETFRFGDGRTVNTRVVEETEWADANLDGAIDPDED